MCNWSGPKPNCWRTHKVEEPLIAGGVKCHGGFDERRQLRLAAHEEPRTAIENWKAEHAKNFGTELLDIGLDRWPAHYPNVAQAKFLLEQGVTEPMISTITRVGTVEGFGAFLRYSPIPDLQANFVEPINGTAMAHLGGGLFEAHARDEAGFESEDGFEGGHKQMWFAARDVAFENPVTEDQVDVMLARMGIGARASTQTKSTGILCQLSADQMLPDIDPYLESLIQRMTVAAAHRDQRLPHLRLRRRSARRHRAHRGRRPRVAARVATSAPMRRRTSSTSRRR